MQSRWLARSKFREKEANSDKKARRGRRRRSNGVELCGMQTATKNGRPPNPILVAHSAGNMPADHSLPRPAGRKGGMKKRLGKFTYCKGRISIGEKRSDTHLILHEAQVWQCSRVSTWAICVAWKVFIEGYGNGDRYYSKHTLHQLEMSLTQWLTDWLTAWDGKNGSTLVSRDSEWVKCGLKRMQRLGPGQYHPIFSSGIAN